MFRSAPIATAAGVVVILGSAFGCTTTQDMQGETAGARAAHTVLTWQLDTLEHAARLLDSLVARPLDAANGAAVQRAYGQARRAFKRAEGLLEFFDAPTALRINGPPVDEIEPDEGPDEIKPAVGLQVLEPFLFPVIDTARLADIRREAATVLTSATHARLSAHALVMQDGELFDAARTEIARVVVHGITGFDSPIRKASLPEARVALDGLRTVLAAYVAHRGAASAARTELDAAFARADAALDAGFDAFNRLGFIVTAANPLARAVARTREASGVALPAEARVWRVNAPTLFERGAFDANAIRPAWPEHTNDALAELGERLFADPVLSGNGARSCTFCHQPTRAFTDGLARSVSLESGTLLRNAPTLVNAALQQGQFADLRANFLEDQIGVVIASTAEMHGDLRAIAGTLRRDWTYVAAFGRAFESRNADSVVIAPAIRAALAAYIRTLVHLDSRADSALRGDTTVLTPEERLGFNVFAGKAACATCHFLPLTSGTEPPGFAHAETEVLGVPGEPVWRHARIDRDTGRIVVTHVEPHRFAFKTPTLRNVALTAPYMHNGIYRTLEDVVRFYNGGGGAGLGIALPNQTLSPDSLRLTDVEQRALVQFLRTLTDTSGTTRRFPPRATR